MQPQTWISNSTIGDYLKCPRAYYLKNVYKNERGKKIAIINPYLTLGQVVHEVLESLAKIKSEVRLNAPLLEQYEQEWSKFTGENGGFSSQTEENDFKERGRGMIKRVIENPGPLKNKALRLISPDSLPPRFPLSLEHNILLCGKIDWLEYIPHNDSVHIIDFKTGKNEEDENSLQLPIYCLLVKNLQKRKVGKISYWYIDRDINPKEKDLPDFEKAYQQVLEIALKIKEMREKKEYNCRKNGCFACRTYERIIEGKAKYLGTKGYQDIYKI